MQDVVKIVESIKSKLPFEPIDDRVLIKPLKLKTKKKTVMVPESVDTQKPEEQETKMVEQVQELPLNCQLGIILKIGVTGAVNVPFKEGDTIVYPTGAGMAFELFKDSRLLKRYEILGLWSQ